MERGIKKKIFSQSQCLECRYLVCSFVFILSHAELIEGKEQAVMKRHPRQVADFKFQG